MRPLPKQIFTFLVLVFAFSSLPYYLMIHTGHIAAGNGMAVALVMWCPALAAFATCGLLKIDLATLGWSWRPARWVAWAYVIPILYALPVYVVTWVAIPGSFAFSQFAAPLAKSFGFPNSPTATALFLAIPGYATLGVISSMARALGEEIGWRGFLLPRLVKATGFTVGCLISGCIWAVWHYPGLLFADYNAGTKPAYALACFTVMVIADAYILGWMRLKSGSLWPAAMLHASHNLFIQAIFDRMTAPVGRALYVTTEFGCGLALTVAAFALYFWTRRKEVLPVELPAS
ncbi:MAG TPA: type II CAAX endopeptidase family protein [Candidatus Limnocylindrales bacterium]|nr:type II CAAX endopeptidase family protein [Candidatus Limnocylindrales bacterium]